jgi:peptidoglycan/xylan/chitin deacetylase (PgdA/CDA1 family)
MPSRPAFLAAALLALFLAAPAGAVETPAAPQCAAPWSPAEKIVRRHAPGAAVAIPAYDALPAAPPLAAGLRGSIRRVDLPPGVKLVALTFDFCETAGEIAGYDGEIVDELRRRRIPSTFFVGGHWATTHPGRFAEMAGDPLFEIANHTWTHANLRTTDDERLKREILAPEAAFRAAVTAPLCPRPDAWSSTKRSKYLRFPFGACDARSMSAVNDAGMAAIQWDVSTGDPSPFFSADMIVAETLRSVRPGSIVLAHANGRGFHTGAALPRVLDELSRRGYRFVTVSDLLAAGRPVITETCYDARPGDTDKYDHLGKKPNPKPLPEPQKPRASATTSPPAAPPPKPPAPAPLRPAL